MIFLNKVPHLFITMQKKICSKNLFIKVLLSLLTLLILNGCITTKAKQYRDGSTLSQDEIDLLEDKIEKAPTNLKIRKQLVEFYFKNLFPTGQSKILREKHILWIIKNRPGSKIAGSPKISLNSIANPEAYDIAKKLWSKNSKKFDKNEVVLNNAAKFFLLFDTPLAKKFLNKGKKLTPNNPIWSESLANLYMLDMITKNDDSGIKALKEMETAYYLTINEQKKFYILTDLCRIAFDIGNKRKAIRYSKEVLIEAQKYPNDWNYGNAIHYANQILGTIAMASGNIEDAKRFLINSAKSSGSPQLNSFGPSMLLAKELLDNKEQATVLEYLELCLKFWQKGEDKLKIWIKGIKDGDTPDFDRSLMY